MSSGFPIEAIREGFLQALRDAPSVLVVAPTGSGKSTQLPLWMEEASEGRVMVVEPRRVACKALASFCASRRGESVGQSIGYRVRFDSKVSASTRIEFVTPGVALRLLHEGHESSEQGCPPYTAFLIDEFHERQWAIDLIVACLRMRQRDGASFPLVLTSATIETEAIQRVLGATLLEATGRSFPVSVSYDDSASMPSARDLEERVTQVVSRELRKSDPGDDMLVFLPGKGEIEACRRALLPVSQKASVDLVPLHGSLPMERLSRALSPDAPRARVYLATNVAETSLTLPRVTCVVDTGLARMRIHRGGHSALALVPISQGQMDQRAGRAGRVAPGRCVRLWQASFVAPPDNQPEIERVELDDLLIQAARMGLDGNAFDEAPWLATPPAFAVEAARLRLQNMGALDEAFRLTQFGEELAEWPISAEEACWLAGSPPELQGTLADLVACLQQPSSFLLPVGALGRDAFEAVVEARQELLRACGNDVMTALTLLRKGDSKRHHLHHSGLRQARAIARQLRQRLGVVPVAPEEDELAFPAADVLARWMLSRAPSLGFVRRPRADKTEKKGRGKPQKGPIREPWANGVVEVQIEPFVPVSDDLEVPTPRAGLVLAMTWVGHRGVSIQGRGRMVLPCSKEVMAEVGLGEEEVAAPLCAERDGELTVTGRVTRSLAGVVLSQSEVVLSGEALRVAIVDLMQAGRMWTSRWEALLDALHLLALVSAWPAPREWDSCPEAQQWVDTPRDYLLSVLEELGLQSVEELALLEEDDLLPDIKALTGVPFYELEALAADFPRVWTLKGAEYVCDVRPMSAKVRLTPANGVARKAKEPGKQFLPSFRGFHVEYQQASRVLRLR